MNHSGYIQSKVSTLRTMESAKPSLPDYRWRGKRSSQNLWFWL